MQIQIIKKNYGIECRNDRPTAITFKLKLNLAVRKSIGDLFLSSNLIQLTNFTYCYEYCCTMVVAFIRRAFRCETHHGRLITHQLSRSHDIHQPALKREINPVKRLSRITERAHYLLLISVFSCSKIFCIFIKAKLYLKKENIFLCSLSP